MLIIQCVYGSSMNTSSTASSLVAEKWTILFGLSDNEDAAASTGLEGYCRGLNPFTGIRPLTTAQIRAALRNGKIL